MSDVAKKGYLPGSPYPGIDPFSFAYRDLFFARETEARSLIRLIVMYRGVLLYSDSGMGKTSLVNAGLIRQAIDEGYQPERIRVQSKTEQEIVVERLSQEVEGEPPFLPSIFASDDQRESVVLSVAQFMEKVRHGAESGHPLLIFDQFEEWVTLFGEGSGVQSAQEVRAGRERILDAIVSLINDSLLPVKVLIALREDYLPKLTPFFERCPNLPDHYLWLTPLTGDQVYRAIREPFENYPETYQPEISPSLAGEIVKQFEGRSGGAAIHLTEVQIVCQDLFGSGKEEPELEQYFADQGEVQGILEGYLDLVLESLGSDLQDPALALLTRMVTPAGTRNVISRDDLLTRVEHEENIRRDLLEATLDRLDQETKLVRSEPRREVRYYEIASEFLVERIRKEAQQRQELAEQSKLAIAQQRADQEARTAKRFRRWAVGLAVALLAIAIIGLVAIYNYRLAEKEAWNAKYFLARALTVSAQEVADRKPQLSLLLVLAARDQLEKLPEKPQNIRRLHEQIADTEEVLHQLLGQSGGLTLPWPAHEGGVRAVYFEPGGHKLIASGKDDFVRRWDVADLAAEPEILYNPETEAESVAFSTDGRWLIAPGTGGTVQLREITDLEAEPIVLPEEHKDSVKAVAPDRSVLASGGSDGTVRLWQLDNSQIKPTTVLTGHTGEVKSVAFSPDRTRLATGSSDGTVRLWQLDGSKDKATASRNGHKDGVIAVALGPDGRWLITVSGDGTARLWSVQDSVVEPVELRGHTGKMKSAAFSPDNRPDATRWLAAGSEEGTVWLWDLDNLEAEPVALRGHEDSVRAIRFGEGGWMASEDESGNVRLWRTSSWAADPVVLSQHTGWVQAVRFYYDDRLATDRLATGGSDNIVLSWNVHDWVPESTFLPDHEGSVERMAFGPDGIWLAVARKGGTVERLYLANRKAELVPLSTQEVGGDCTAFSADGGWVAIGSKDGTARVWDITDRDPDADHTLSGYEGCFTSMALSTAEKWVALGGEDGSVRFWDIANPDPRLIRVSEHSDSSVECMAASPGGHWLVTGSSDGTLLRWDTADLGDDPIPLSKPEVAEESVAFFSLAFSLDGHFLASGSEDGSVMLWDWDNIALMDEPILLRGHDNRVESLSFSRDGRWLASGSRDKTVRLWHLRPDDLIELACRTAGRNLYDKETEEFLADQEDRRTCPGLPGSEGAGAQ